MSESLSVLEKSNNVERLSLDNYRVSSETLTETAKDDLLENPNVSGVLITEDEQVIGSKDSLGKNFSNLVFSVKSLFCKGFSLIIRLNQN
jgi:hypothetical protein